MSDNIEVSVTIPTDENGMLGRECLECKKYFKLKPETGLPIDYCHCPYCDYEGKSDTFWTEAQIEYAKSKALNQAVNQFLKPSLDSLRKTFRDLERKTRNSFIQFKFKESNESFTLPIKYYSEKDLETNVTCTSCGLVFSVYGVFARCPDCTELNAFLIYSKSLEITEKQIAIFQKPDIPTEIKTNSLKFILSDCISSFDGLGKELRRKKPDLYSERPKNLFQNIYVLNQTLDNLIYVKHSDVNFLQKMFQVRHIYEHNMGVIDEDFINKVNGYSSKLGMKYNLSIDEVILFVNKMKELGEIIKNHYESN